MAIRAPNQTEATTVRVPQFSRDDDRRYSVEAVYESLARYIRRRHGLMEERKFRKAMTPVFSAVRNDHSEYVHAVLEARINLEIQETLRELTEIANTYSVPIRR